MSTDLTLYLDDQPGELARIGDVLGNAGANIAGLCALSSGGGQAEVHILVHDATAAFEALQRAGIRIAAEQEMVLEIEDRPGALGEVARKLGEARVNLTLVYSAANTRLVLAADNLADAKAAIAESYLVRLDFFSCAFGFFTDSAAARLACLALS